MQTLGYQPGQRISKEEFGALKSAYDYYVKGALDQRKESESKVARLMQTNTEDGQRINLLIQPDGTAQVLKPELRETKDGTMAIINHTNAVPVVNVQTKQPIMGYAAEPDWGPDTNRPTLPGATNAPTPTPTPAPTPKPVTVAELQSRLGVSLPPGTHVLPNGRTITVVP